MLLLVNNLKNNHYVCKLLYLTVWFYHKDTIFYQSVLISTYEVNCCCEFIQQNLFMLYKNN